ncbi:MAG: Pr6Pr family membrane protein [Candidatus Hodarchaeales archaeon]
MNNIKGSQAMGQFSNYVLIYRLALVILGAFTIISSHILRFTAPENASLSIPEKIFGVYRYFTMQTNLMVLVWLVLAVLWMKNPDRMDNLNGIVRGAITLYITVTFLVFAIVLSPLYHPSGFEGFLNLSLHYIMPIAFIIDFFATEELNYKWRFTLYWLIYPLCYLVFSLIHGLTTGDFIYPFLNFETLGFEKLIISLIILVGLFIFLSVVYIVLSKKITPIYNYFKR